MDKKYFEDIYINYFKVLRFFALRIVNNAAVAEDVVQDVFTEFWARRSLIDSTKSIKPYLYKLTYNRCLDFLRSKGNANITLSEKPSILNDILYSAFTTDEYVLISDISKEMEIAIDALPDRCKEIFLLSRKSNLKNREIADVLNISVKAVEKQITKALQNLKSHLTKTGYIVSLIVLLFLLSN